MSAPIYCALLHHPVRDRAGDTVTTAVTTLDVHDIARSARTYGVRRYFVVTPIEAQHLLIARILRHWQDGAGASRMPERGEALGLVEVRHTLAQALEAITHSEGVPPRVVATAARAAGRTITGFKQLRGLVETHERPVLLLFGTGHGLADGVLAEADMLLEPICGAGDYNHLSVRSAVAIALDRLAGN